MTKSLEIRGETETRHYITKTTKEHLQEVLELWEREDQLIPPQREHFTEGRLSAYRERTGRRTTVSPENPIHIHPDPEFVMLGLDSRVRIQFYDRDRGTRRTTTYRNTGPEDIILEIAPQTIHVIVLMDGPITIFTTQRNISGPRFLSFQDAISFEDDST